MNYLVNYLILFLIILEQIKLKKNCIQTKQPLKVL